MSVLDSFLMACNAILPIVVLVVVGYILKRVHFINDDFQQKGNSLCFKILIPILLFYNIYKIDDISKITEYGLFFVYIAVALLVLFLIGWVIVKFMVPNDKQKGVIHQCLYRSNYALIGIPLAEYIAESLGYTADSPMLVVATLVSAVSVPLFNIFAVISLSIFDKGDGNNKIHPKKILIDIVKNPLIIGVLTGIVVLCFRQILVACNVSFRFSDISWLYRPLEQLAHMASPLALVMLGAGFTFGAVKRLKYQIMLGTALRNFLVPALGLISFYFILTAQYGDAELYFPSLIALFATPIAVSSAPMAYEMGQDGELAGQLVVWTSIMSILALFIIIMICGAVGIFTIA